MKLTIKQLRIYVALGCRTMDDIRACKRMVKQVIEGK